MPSRHLSYLTPGEISTCRWGSLSSGNAHVLHKALQILNIIDNINAVVLLLGMQPTQQQKKYFSVFKGDKQRKVLKGQRFTAVSEEGCIYVDKTPLIKRLLKEAHRGTGVFVNRPRGFGKSLLVSTLEECFKGNKEAFRGTAIYNDPEVKWEKWPVIKFDMSRL